MFRIVKNPTAGNIKSLSSLGNDIVRIRRALVQGGATGHVADSVESAEFDRMDDHQAVYKVVIDDAIRLVTVRIHADVADNLFFAAYL